MIFEIKLLDTGMEPKVFWGIILCQGQREIPGEGWGFHHELV
jgi:hypothetical protein